MELGEIKECLDKIESSSKTLSAFIEGLVCAATLQGLGTDEVYRVNRLFSTANNIGCYSRSVREMLDKDALLGVGEK